MAVALGSVAFDGFSRSIAWQNLIARVEAPYILNQPGTGELLVTGISLLGLVAAITFVLGGVLGACAIARATVKAPRSLAPDFVLSLVPIALVYAIAHYFSLFVIQGQYMIQLLSDPLGKGWDLSGRPASNRTSRSSVRTRSGPSSSRRSCWATWQGRRRSRPGGDGLPRPPGCAPSQYAMLALMVLYTLGGLFLLFFKW